VNDRMAVGKSVNVTMKYNALADQLGIFEIILPLYIVAYIISYNNPIRITGKIYMGEDIHAIKKTIKHAEIRYANYTFVSSF
jgi:hypothetical protein